MKMAQQNLLVSGPVVDDIVRLMRQTKTISDKAVWVRKHSINRVEHIKEMFESDAINLRNALTEENAQMNTMRRKVIAMAHQIGWKHPDGSGKIDMHRIEDWMMKYRHKGMNAQSKKELSDSITQFENMFRNQITRRRK